MFKKSITWFIITQILLSLFILFAIGLTTPSPFASYYQPQHGSFYIVMNSLLILPIYLIIGLILGKIFHIDASKKSLITTTVIGASVLTLLFIIASIMDDHSSWLLYALLNVPHGWTMAKFSHTDDYKSLFGLLFTVAPPIFFTLGIYLNNVIWRKHIDLS